MLFKGGVAHIPIWVNSRHLLFNAHNNILQTIRIHVTIKIKHISFSFKAFLLSNLKYISEIILEKFLRANRAEVIAVSIFEYSKEEEEQKVSVRSRYLGDEGAKELNVFIDAIKDEIQKKTIRKIEVED